MDYEVYVCAHENGCKTISVFECHGDFEAAKTAREKIENYEKESGDTVYREYLFRNDNNEQVEICI